ncbi:unnamed protein product [Dovyalis caffra]|uniref:Uncharacterized protein n=1 Tax=Dovyalis caffra TaxID=77055 RepID=A0AAV1QZJ0_9ROSI|nr:unnamed protein product [Dovyalis caffra]
MGEVGDSDEGREGGRMVVINEGGWLDSTALRELVFGYEEEWFRDVEIGDE